MQPTRAHIIATVLACIALIGLAATIRSLATQSAHDTSQAVHIVTETPSAIDQSFYENTQATSSTSKPVVPVKPASDSNGLTARSYLIGDADTGKIYFEVNSSLVLPVASMSKLVTAFAATDMMDPSTRITITQKETEVPPDASNLKAGETFTVGELLYPLLLNSSNVAAEALASSTDRAHFLELMSSYAWEVGMPTAYFADPSGVDPRNAASARDIFALAQYLIKYRPDILAVTRTPQADTATTSDHGSHAFVSIHPFVKETGFVGGKTGHTPEAKDTMMTIMSIGGKNIVFVVLASNDRAADTARLISIAKKTI